MDEMQRKLQEEMKKQLRLEREELEMKMRDEQEKQLKSDREELKKQMRAEQEMQKEQMEAELKRKMESDFRGLDKFKELDISAGKPKEGIARGTIIRVF